MSAPNSAKSWFQQISTLCMKYNLPHPLQQLEARPDKQCFKKQLKAAVCQYWENTLRREASELPSLKYFCNWNYTLSKPSSIWTSVVSRSYECHKAVALARMLSGRYRTQKLASHWSSNRNGFCLAPTCTGKVEDIEHILVECPALAAARSRLKQLFFTRTTNLPYLYHLICGIFESAPEVQTQFILDPTAFQEVLRYVCIICADHLHITYTDKE